MNAARTQHRDVYRPTRTRRAVRTTYLIVCCDLIVNISTTESSCLDKRILTVVEKPRDTLYYSKFEPSSS